MIVRLHRIIIPVLGIDRARAFYGSLFEREGVLVSPGRLYFQLGDIVVACYDGVEDGDGRRALPLDEPIYFRVDDIHEAHRRCAQLGASFPDRAEEGVGALGEVLMRPWGERCFYILDPFDNSICLVEAATALFVDHVSG